MARSVLKLKCAKREVRLLRKSIPITLVLVTFWKFCLLFLRKVANNHTMKIFALLLAVLGTSHAFTSTSKPASASTTVALEAHGRYGSYHGYNPYSHLMTGGEQGSYMMYDRGVNINAPWGSMNPYVRDQRAVNGNAGPHGMTGGTGGSRFVSERINPDAAFSREYYMTQHEQGFYPRYYR